MPPWISLILLCGAAIASLTSLQNLVHELRSGSLRPKLLFWVVPGWNSKRRESPSAYWIGIATGSFRTCLFGIMALAAAAALQGTVPS